MRHAAISKTGKNAAINFVSGQRGAANETLTTDFFIGRRRRRLACDQGRPKALPGDSKCVTEVLGRQK